MSESTAPMLPDIESQPRSSERLRAEVCRVPDLDETLRESMYSLYARYYDATDPALFQRDLDGKDLTVLMRDDAGRLRGFSSLATSRVARACGKQVRAIFSGDTIVHHRYWGQQALAFTWIRLAGQLARDEPEVPLYWFLIVKGHRTYRYLHAFTRHYYPHWREPTPSYEQSLMHELAARRFGHHYDSERGLVRYRRSRGHLAGVWAGIEDRALGRPEVAYFARRNPGYGSGDELVCLTRIDGGNLRPLAQRLFAQGFAR